jgi:Lon protease-like protein
MFPLSVVLYPYTGIPLQVFEPRYLELLSVCLEEEQPFGVVLISRGSEVGGGDRRVDIGTVVRVADLTPLPDARFALMAESTGRLRVTEWLEDDPYPQAIVEDLPGQPFTGEPVALTRAESSVRRLRSLLSELGRVPAIPHDLDFGSTPDEIVWRLCASAPLNPLDGQRLLAIDDPGERLDELVGLCDAMAGDVTAMLADGVD